MEPRSRHRTIVAGAFAIGLLAVAAPAQAIFLITPLHLTAPGGTQVEVGDEIDLVVDAINETAREALKGKLLRVTFTGFENQDLQGPVTSALQLDQRAHATLTWIVPAAADDQNLLLHVLDGEEELATLHLVVGDAEPMAFLMSGPGAQEGTGDAPIADQGKDGKAVPGVETVFALAGLGAVAVGLALARRRA